MLCCKKCWNFETGGSSHACFNRHIVQVPANEEMRTRRMQDARKTVGFDGKVAARVAPTAADEANGPISGLP